MINIRNRLISLLLLYPNGGIIGEKEIDTGEKRESPKIRISHEMPPDRKKAVKDAMKAKKMPKPEWDRINEPSVHKFNRKKVNPGEIRTIKLNLLKVTIGDSWPTSVCILHGKRPGPIVTIIGAIHGDELTGPSACAHLLSEALTADGGPLDPKKIAGTIRIVPVINTPDLNQILDISLMERFKSRISWKEDRKYNTKSCA